jgi:hypothetical protein
MFTDLLQPVRPLTIENTGLLAYIGRILRARGARVYWSRSAIVVETDDSDTAAQLRRVVETHSKESTHALVVSQRDALTFTVTRAVA